MPEDLDAVVGNAVEQTVVVSKEEAPTESVAPSTENKDQQTGAAAEKPSTEGTAPAKAGKTAWDGNIEALPEELREYAKGVQRYVTKHTTEAAEYRKKVEEYEKKFPSEKMTEFERWKAQEAIKSQTKPEGPSISQEEWEDALLDGTGQKINALIARQTKHQVETARNEFMANMKAEQDRSTQLLGFQQRVKEFAELHPDFKRLNDAGILMPILTKELDAGGTLESAYASAQMAYENIKAMRDIELKELAEQKKAATTLNGKTSNEDHVLWVDSKDEAIEAQINAAIDNRSVRVRVRPPKK
jgi:hypothetical protein